MHYRELLPPRDLAPFVHCFWLLQAEATPTPLVEPVLPDCGVELVVHVGDRFLRHRDGRPHLQPRALLVGQLTGPLAIQATGTAAMVAARFRIGGASPFLGGLPLCELTDRDVDADDVWPDDGRALVTAIGDASTDAERVAPLIAFLRTRLRLQHHHPAVGAAATWFDRPGASATPIDALAHHLDLGPRQLQRLFDQHVGLGPKRIGRIRRFQELLAAVRATPNLPFAALAVRCGYADQAHLGRDFREFAGTTPSRWLAQHTPLAARLAGFDDADVASVQGRLVQGR